MVAAVPVSLRPLRALGARNLLRAIRLSTRMGSIQQEADMQRATRIAIATGVLCLNGDSRKTAVPRGSVRKAILATERAQRAQATDRLHPAPHLFNELPFLLAD